MIMVVALVGILVVVACGAVTTPARHKRQRDGGPGSIYYRGDALVCKLVWSLSRVCAAPSSPTTVGPSSSHTTW